MELNISDYVSFVKLKNGKFKVTRDENNLENIYRLLRDMGYGYVRENSRNVYFRREGSGIVLTRLCDFQKAFLKLVKDCELLNLPSNVSILDIFKYYRTHPIKRDDLFAKYFEYDLIGKGVA